jgi:hypothetical protein
MCNCRTYGNLIVRLSTKLKGECFDSNKVVSYEWVIINVKVFRVFESGYTMMMIW